MLAAAAAAAVPRVYNVCMCKYKPACVCVYEYTTCSGELGLAFELLYAPRGVGEARRPRLF